MDQTSRLGLALLLAGASAAVMPSRSFAESEPFNLHLDLGVGRAIAGPLAPPSDDGEDRVPTIAWLSADWPIVGMFAFEVIAGAGYQFELSDEPGAEGDGFWQLGAGVRARVLNDQEGYADDPGGNLSGDFWVSGHAGYYYLDGVQFGMDVGAGYEWSISRPFQAGLFARALVLVGGQRSDADAALVVGISGSLGLNARRVEPIQPRGTRPSPLELEELEEDHTIEATPPDETEQDTDGDTVADYVDECPDTPRGIEVGPNGCVVAQERMELQGVQFAPGKSELLPESEDTLRTALQVLRDNPDVRVEIAGYTDNTGSAAVNQRLSRKRAEAVRDWLTEHGIAANRLRVRGYGPASPVAPNDTDEGRARNRRIEFHRLDGEGATTAAPTAGPTPIDAEEEATPATEPPRRRARPGPGPTPTRAPAAEATRRAAPATPRGPAATPRRAPSPPPDERSPEEGDY